MSTLQSQAEAHGYRVGDIIDFYGATGTITDITDDPHTLMRDYPIHVTMDTGHIMYFTIDGKMLKTQKVTNQLVVTGRARPVIKKWKWVAPAGDGTYMVTDRWYADDEAVPGGAQKILASEIEVAG